MPGVHVRGRRPALPAGRPGALLLWSAKEEGGWWGKHGFPHGFSSEQERVGRRVAVREERDVVRRDVALPAVSDRGGEVRCPGRTRVPDLVPDLLQPRLGRWSPLGRDEDDV